MIAFINNTKNNVVSNLNYDNNLSVHNSNYQKKEANIPLSFYENIFNNIQTLFYDKYSTDNKNNWQPACLPQGAWSETLPVLWPLCCTPSWGD